jgi:hypothetical protein
MTSHFSLHDDVKMLMLLILGFRLNCGQCPRFGDGSETEISDPVLQASLINEVRCLFSGWQE